MKWIKENFLGVSSHNVVVKKPYSDGLRDGYAAWCAIHPEVGGIVVLAGLAPSV
jgi:hypothetical protein